MADADAILAPKRAAERIRDVARELFYRQGIRAVGVDEIVTRAGVTKPSLYRSFASKDALAAAYVAQYHAEFAARFEAVIAAHPGDPAAGVVAWFESLAERAASKAWRGCGVSNAAVEYPEAGHPARTVAETAKAEVRARLRVLCRDMAARDPDDLADALMLLMEGCYLTRQLFPDDGPIKAAASAAKALIRAHTA